MMPSISQKPSIDDTIAVSAITQFVESIITTLPMNIVTAETRLVRLFCSVCPGLGIIRKKPDIRWKDPTQLAQLPAVQLSILNNVSAYVRPGGVLVYATCTVLPEENGGVVSAFLDVHPDFAKEE